MIRKMNQNYSIVQTLWISKENIRESLKSFILLLLLLLLLLKDPFSYFN